MRFTPLALVTCLGLAGGVQAAEPDPYIFDVLALQPYRGNLARLVKTREAPDWVKAIVSQGEGTAVPSKSVDIGGTPYRLDRVCKVHDCAGNTLDVLWAPRGAKVWAALVDGGKPALLLGDPKPPQAKALQEAAAAAPAAPAAATPIAPPTADLPASSATAPATMPAAEAPK